MTRYGDIARMINGLEIPQDSLQTHTDNYFPLRGEGRDVSAVPVKPVCVLDYPLHTVLRAQPAPGLPCALCGSEGQRDAQPGRKPVAGMRTLACAGRPRG